MKIAIISEEFLPQKTGVSINQMKRLRVFSERGHEVRVYSPDYSVLEEQYPDWRDYVGKVLPGVTVIPFPSQAASLGELSKSTMVDPRPFSMAAVDRNMLEFKPDIIHVDSPERIFFGSLSVPGKKVAKKLGVPLVSFYHTYFVLVLPKLKDYIPWVKIPGVLRFLHWLNIWVYKQYPLVLTASSDTQNTLQGWGLTHTRNEILLGVELELFMPSDNSDSDQALTFISVSRFDPDKNVDWLLDICTAINKSGINCRFIFVGGGIEVDKVLDWVGKNNNAEYAGFLDNAATVPYYQQSDVFITAATHETFGTTLVEAASCGLALMGYAEGAVVDRIEHGGNGYLVETGAAEEFATLACRLHDDPELLKAFKQRSRQLASLYENSATADRLLGIWQQQIELEAAD